MPFPTARAAAASQYLVEPSVSEDHQSYCSMNPRFIPAFVTSFKPASVQWDRRKIGLEESKYAATRVDAEKTGDERRIQIDVRTTAPEIEKANASPTTNSDLCPASIKRTPTDSPILYLLDSPKSPVSAASTQSGK